jgi:hypothetical protein
VADEGEEVGGDDDTPLGELVEALHAELEATEELPVERGASRWIGEAQGVVSGLVGGGLDETVVRERVGHVVDLLSNVETTGHDAADEHVDAARELARVITDRSSTDEDY